MPTVLGIDSSTQSLSALILDVGVGKIVHQASVNFGADLPGFGHPSGFLPGGANGEVHANPLLWLEALDLLFTRLRAAGVDLGSVAALSGSGQQHGSVYLNGRFAGVLAGLDPAGTLAGQLAPCLSRATSPIWMDTSTASECRDIAEALGGNAEVCRRSGSVATERFTGPQIRRFARLDPEGWGSTAVVHLVSSFMASVLCGDSAAIDVGDGAGMNLMNLASLDWDNDLMEATAPGLAGKLPPVKPSGTVAGRVAPYFAEKYGLNPSCAVVLFSGDNPCSLVGMGASRPGNLVISLGTSDTIFAAMPEARTDPGGFGHAFGNPMGGYMSLICFKNGSLARERVKDDLGLSWTDFDRAGLSRTPMGNGGRIMLPFYEPEITPRVEAHGPVFAAWPGYNRAAPEMVRAVLEGQFTNMWLHSRWLGCEADTILLTGGASQNDGIAQTVADVFGVPAKRLEVTGSAALGAGMRAAAAAGLATLDEMEEAFCRARPGSQIDPQPGSAEAYGAFKESFHRALREAFPGL